MSPADRSDVVTRLLWTLRRSAVLGAAAVLACATLGVVVAPRVASGPSYRATALVVAVETNLSVAELTRLAEALFETERVADRVVEELGTMMPGTGEVTDHIALEPVRDTIALRVVGRAQAPELAAQFANAAAEAFVAEANRLGSGVGRFRLHLPATDPDRPHRRALTPVTSAAGGAAAGALLWLGIGSAWLAIRRPVLHADDVRDLTDAPVLGVHSRRGRVWEPARMLGLSALVSALFPTRTERCLFLSVRGQEHIRSCLATVTAQILGHPDGAVLARAQWTPDGGTMHQEGWRVMRMSWSEREDTNPMPRVVDGPPLRGLDTAQLLPADVATVLVVRRGTATPRLRSALEQLAGVADITLVLADGRFRRLPGKQPEPRPASFTSTPDIGEPASGSQNGVPPGVRRLDERR